MQINKTYARVKLILDPRSYSEFGLAPDPYFFQLIFCKVIDGLQFTQPDTKEDSVYLKAAKCL